MAVEIGVFRLIREAHYTFFPRTMFSRVRNAMKLSFVFYDHSNYLKFQKESISSFYGMLLHEGQYFDPVMRDIESFLLNSQKNVSGTVYLKLKPYSFDLEGIKSKNDLMTNEFGTYGEVNKNWNATDVKGFIKINANAGKIYHNLKK